MTEPLAYLNGQFIPGSQAVLSVVDGGFVQGTTVAEQLRTFNGTLFRLEEHVRRLYRSLAIVEVEPAYDDQHLIQIALELAANNHALLAEGDDLGLAMFVTPGPYGAMTPDAPGPTVCMHTFPLRFAVWAEKYRQGESLATTDIEQVSARSWPPELKCRSRMHYYLADRAARFRFPGSRALMTDEDGFVTEATTANIALFSKKSGLVLPPDEKVLPGISLSVLVELADDANIAVTQRDLSPLDVATADEVFLTSTSPCMLPVTRFNGQPIGAGVPGPAFERFMAAWNEMVGLDVVAQAQRFSSR